MLAAHAPAPHLVLTRQRSLHHRSAKRASQPGVPAAAQARLL